jgi:hypothetical protein
MRTSESLELHNENFEEEERKNNERDGDVSNTEVSQQAGYTQKQLQLAEAMTANQAVKGNTTPISMMNKSHAELLNQLKMYIED